MLRGLPRLQCNFFCVWLELRTSLPQYTQSGQTVVGLKTCGRGWGGGFQSCPFVFGTKSSIHTSTRTSHVQTRRTRRRGGAWGWWADACRAWRKPRPAGGRKSERRLKPPLPLLRLRLRRQQLHRQQLRRTRLRLRTTSGASIRGEHRGRASGASIGGGIGGVHRG